MSIDDDTFEPGILEPNEIMKALSAIGDSDDSGPVQLATPHDIRTFGEERQVYTEAPSAAVGPAGFGFTTITVPTEPVDVKTVDTMPANLDTITEPSELKTGSPGFMEIVARRLKVRRAVRRIPNSNTIDAAIRAARPLGTHVVQFVGTGNSGKSTLSGLIALALSSSRLNEHTGVLTADHAADAMRFRFGFPTSSALGSCLNSLDNDGVLPSTTSSYVRSIISYCDGLGVLLPGHNPVLPRHLQAAMTLWHQHGDILVVDLGSDQNVLVNKYAAQVSSVTVLVVQAEPVRLAQAARIVRDLDPDKKVLLVVNHVRSGRLSNGDPIVYGDDDLAPLRQDNVTRVWFPYCRDLVEDPNGRIRIEHLSARTDRRIRYLASQVISLLAETSPVDMEHISFDQTI